jgi:hypothetical protein
MSYCTYPILSASLLTTVWHVLGFQIEETASNNGKQLWIYCINSCGQLKRDGLKPGGYMVGYQLLATKNKSVMTCHEGPWAWTDSSDTQVKFSKMGIKFGTSNIRRLYSADSLMTVVKKTIKIYVGFNGGIRGQIRKRWHQTGMWIYIFLWKGEWKSGIM